MERLSIGKMSQACPQRGSLVRRFIPCTFIQHRKQISQSYRYVEVRKQLDELALWQERNVWELQSPLLRIPFAPQIQFVVWWGSLWHESREFVGELRSDMQWLRWSPEVHKECLLSFVRWFGALVTQEPVVWSDRGSHSIHPPSTRWTGQETPNTLERICGYVWLVVKDVRHVTKTARWTLTY